MKIHTEIESAQKLRQRSEAKNQVDMAMTSQPLPATETERFLHELQVHQIELEKQNEQLFHTQSELERKILELEDTIKSLNERNEQIRRLDLQQLLIFEASPLGMALVVDRTAIMVNRSFCAMTGYDIDDLIGKSTRINYRSQEDFEQFGAMAYPLLAAGKIVHGASVFRRKNGTCMDVSITGGLCDVNDSAGGTIWMIEDITRNKKEAAVLEARLRLMQRADHNTLQELLRATLDEVESLTGSQIGFFHFVEPDEITLSLHAWSTNTRQGMCQTVPTEGHYPVSKAGVWSE